MRGEQVFETQFRLQFGSPSTSFSFATFASSFKVLVKKIKKSHKNRKIRKIKEIRKSYFTSSYDVLSSLQP